MVDTLPQSPQALSDVAEVTRRMRVMQYGEPMVQRMEAAGRTFGAAPGPAPVAPAAAPVEAPGAMGRMAAKVPTLVRGADGVLRAVGRFGAGTARAAGAFAGPAAGALAVGNEALGVGEVASDPNTTKIDVATRVAEGAGRLGAMGAGAGLGLAAAGPIGGILGGTAGYFAPNAIYAARDWMMNRGARPAPAAAAQVGAAVPESVITPTTPASTAVAPRDPNMIDLVGGGQARPEAMFADLPNDTLVPVRGQGAFKRTTPGNVGTAQAIYTPESAGEVGPGAVTAPAVSGTIPTTGGRTLPNIGAFFGATAQARNIAQDNANKLAREKFRLEYGGKAATAEKDLSLAENERVRTAAARQHLIDNPGDYATAAAIAAGRSLGAGANTFMPSISGNDVIIGNRRTGAAEIQTPKRYATEGHVSYDMNAHKMTRAQVIASYEKQGIDTSRLKK